MIEFFNGSARRRNKKNKKRSTTIFEPVVLLHFPFLRKVNYKTHPALYIVNVIYHSMLI